MSDASKVNLVQLSLPGIAEPLPLVVLPNGDYEIEQRAIAAIAGYKSKTTVHRLLTENQGFETVTKSLITKAQTLVGQGSENGHIEKLITSPETRHVEGKTKPSNTYPLIVAVLCWQWWAERGNAQCAALLAALAAEALEVRADRIAKIERSQVDILPGLKARGFPNLTI